MRMITLMIAAAAAMALTAGCGQNNKKNKENTDEQDSKTLVAYFSATGTTAAVAKTLASVTTPPKIWTGQ